MDTIKLVKEFHDALNEDNEKRRKASFRFMLEELVEFYDATTNVERLDALIDLQYFLDGTLIAYGMHKIKDEAFLEVHRSNMSKLQPDGTMKRREDGKWIKGPNFTPPNLIKFFKL